MVSWSLHKEKKIEEYQLRGDNYVQKDMFNNNSSKTLALVNG